MSRWVCRTSPVPTACTHPHSQPRTHTSSCSLPQPAEVLLLLDRGALAWRTLINQILCWLCRFLELLHLHPLQLACGRCCSLGCCHSQAQSCPTLCNSMDCSPPGFPVHGILQARILEWIAMPSSRGSSQPVSLALQVDSLLSEPPETI